MCLPIATFFDATGGGERGLWWLADWAAIDVGGSISPVEVRVTRDREDLLLDHGDGGDVLRLYGWYTDPVTRPTAQVQFADGTVWTASDLTALGLRVEGTDEADVLTGLPAFPNTLVGLGGDDTLLGRTGDDRLDGGAGNDTMAGGIGNDVYVVDSVTDIVTENPDEGTDTVETGITYTLGANVENLTLTGTAAVNGMGNVLDNVLRGNSAVNNLSGGEGTDTLDGLGGADTLTGGVGNDTYVLGRGYGADTVVENDATAGNTDVAQFLAGIAADQLWFRHLGSDLEVSIIGTGDRVTVSNWYGGSQYHVEQFKTADGKTLLDSQVENLVSAMASLSPPLAGQTTLNPNYQAELNPVIAANWQ